MSTLVTRINSELRGDRAIWAIFAVLAVFSLLAVYSSSGILAYRNMGGNTEAYGDALVGRPGRSLHQSRFGRFGAECEAGKTVCNQVDPKDMDR